LLDVGEKVGVSIGPSNTAGAMSPSTPNPKRPMLRQIVLSTAVVGSASCNSAKVASGRAVMSQSPLLGRGITMTTIYA